MSAEDVGVGAPWPVFGRNRPFVGGTQAPRPRPMRNVPHERCLDGGGKRTAAHRIKSSHFDIIIVFDEYFAMIPVMVLARGLS